MRVTPQQQRIPLVDLATGLIRREWLGVLAAGEESATTADLTALVTAVAGLTARVLDLETRATVAEARLTALEAAQVLPLVFQQPADAVGQTLVVQPAAAVYAMSPVVQPAASVPSLTMVVQPCCP
jgi:hypothetical protein